MTLIDKFPKVFQYPLYQWLLTTACNDTYLLTSGFNLSHKFLYSWHDGSLGHLMEDTALLVIHPLCLSLFNLTTLLFQHHHTDGIHTPRTFCGIGIVGCHLNAKLLHALLPGDSMIRHGVIQHSIHIKEHGLEVDTLKAVSF